MSFDLGCTGDCTSTPFNFTNNLFLGYTNATGGSNVPAVYYAAAPSTLDIVGSHNLEYGMRNGDTCGTNGNICSDPLFVSEPSGSLPPESLLYNFNFHLTSGSPAIGAGTTVSGLTTDYYGVTRPNPPAIGAVEYVGSSTGGAVTSGSVVLSGKVVMQ